MCMCIFLMNATTCRHDIQIDTVKAQSTVIIEIRMYPAKGPMPRASEALFALDIVRCSKSRTTVDARFSGGRGFRRHLLSRDSVRAELQDGEVRRLLICGSL